MCVVVWESEVHGSMGSSHVAPALFHVPPRCSQASAWPRQSETPSRPHGFTRSSASPAQEPRARHFSFVFMAGFEHDPAIVGECTRHQASAGSLCPTWKA